MARIVNRAHIEYDSSYTRRCVWTAIRANAWLIRTDFTYYHMSLLSKNRSVVVSYIPSVNQYPKWFMHAIRFLAGTHILLFIIHVQSTKKWKKSWFTCLNYTFYCLFICVQHCCVHEIWYAHIHRERDALKRTQSDSQLVWFIHMCTCDTVRDAHRIYRLCENKCEKLFMLMSPACALWQFTY